MPHLTLHYTDSLPIDADALLARLNQALIASGHFEEASIKSRAIALRYFRVGDSTPDERAFIHVDLKIMPGRSEAVRAEVSEALLRVLIGQSIGPHPELQLCVEVNELPASYRKHILPAHSSSHP